MSLRSLFSGKSQTKRRRSARNRRMQCRRERLLRHETLEDRRVLSTVPLTDLPLLHSNPGASASLFLDFDGHFEPDWGTHTNITTPAFDKDGDENSFSDTELDAIQFIWTQVAEDFAPFQVDVTTEQPAVLAEGVPNADANGIALRVAIGGSWEDWYGQSVAGCGVIDSFTSSTANVVYVFGRRNPGGRD